jgi:hypothetical protein
MKTLLYVLYTFGVTTGAISLDSYRLDAGTLITVLAVAALFALALNDGRRVARPLTTAPITRFPARNPDRLHCRTNALDLAA